MSREDRCISKYNNKLDKISKLKVKSWKDGVITLTNGKLLKTKEEREKFCRRVFSNNWYVDYEQYYSEIDNEKSIIIDKNFITKFRKNPWNKGKTKYSDIRIKEIGRKVSISKKGKPSPKKGIPTNKPAWNKGKTKYDNESVMSISKNMSGDKNHMFGKKWSQEHIKKQSKLMKEKILKGEFTPNIHNSNTHWQSIVDGVKKFRSSWEAAFYLLNPSYNYEKLRIKYKFKDEEKIYIVDFISYVDKKVIEVKPLSYHTDEKTLKKEEYLKKWCDEHNYVYEMISEDYFASNFDKIEKHRIDEKSYKNIKLMVKKYETKKYKKNTKTQ